MGLDESHNDFVCLVFVCREGKFHVLQEEPDVNTAAAAADSDLDCGAMAFMGMLPMHGMSMPSMAGYSFSRDSPFVEQPGEFSATELDSLKAQLEALLPEETAEGEDGAEGADGPDDTTTSSSS